jgi:ATPase family associated with various cellular activities (AAA)
MGIGFAELEALRLRSKEALEDQQASLARFAVGHGFRNKYDSEKQSISISSTATCSLSLVATTSWETVVRTKPFTKSLIKELLRQRTSADLPKDNPFTIAWILEAVTALMKFSDPLDSRDKAQIAAKVKLLLKAIDDGDGGVIIAPFPYPSTGYLTQLVMRVLKKRGRLSPKRSKKINKWAWAELSKQLALIQADSKSKDSFAVAYLLIVVTSLTPKTEISSEEHSIQRAALETFFRTQLPDGSWPLSRPLFHYPGYGNAYCYEYELLTQLLQEKDLQDLLLEHLPELRKAAHFATESGYRLASDVTAWSSGHHPHVGRPESWATASVYHFFYVLDRLLAEAVRRELFKTLELPYPSPSDAQSEQSEFAKDLLDSSVRLPDGSQHLKELLWSRFVQPISNEASNIRRGIPFEKNTPRSAIFFGPPGTSKTELSKEVARFLGWRFLAVDPSLLLRKGMDGIQAEANSIFRILELTEAVVVLFDEFDELVRERASGTEQPFSRLLTTAMLPKLASLRKKGTLVFIIATNNIAQFDLAIRRPGRFDRIFQIMPPTLSEKLKKRNWVGLDDFNIKEKLKALHVALDRKVKNQLDSLTFAECEAFAAELFETTSVQSATSALDAAWNRCTLQAPVSEGDAKTWANRCKEEESFNRLR